MTRPPLSLLLLPVAALSILAANGCATAHDCGNTGGASTTSGTGGEGGGAVCGNGILEPGEQCDGMVHVPAGKICVDCALETLMPPVINEIYYPQGASVGCYIEILGTVGFDLTGWSVQAVSPITGEPSLIASLKGLKIGDTGYFLVVQDNMVPIPAGTNSLTSPATHFTDGPANVQLIQDGKVIDAVSWGDFSSGATFKGEGQPATNESTGNSLCRIPNGADSNNNSADFKSCKSSPGAPNSSM